MTREPSTSVEPKTPSVEPKTESADASTQSRPEDARRGGLAPPDGSQPRSVQLLRLSPLWLVPLALVVGIAVRAVLGNGAFLLVLAAFALLGVIAVFWRSLQSLTGDAPLTLEEALGLGAPSVEEERKVAVLRALKDLEYERAVGKIDEGDFQRLSTKYRAQAMQLLQIVDIELSASRKQAEAELAERLAEAGLAPLPSGGNNQDETPPEAGDDPLEERDEPEGEPDAAPGGTAGRGDVP